MKNEAKTICYKVDFYLAVPNCIGNYKIRNIGLIIFSLYLLCLCGKYFSPQRHRGHRVFLFTMKNMKNMKGMKSINISFLFTEHEKMEVDDVFFMNFMFFMV